MTKPNNNPPDQNSTPTEPADAAGGALRLVRAVIAIGLLVGVGVFGVIAFENLAKGPAPLPAEPGFGTSDQAPDAATNQDNNPLAGLAGLDPSRFTTIKRDNPHPGMIEPFISGDLALLKPHMPILGGPITLERCSYHAPDAQPEDAFAYYKQAAEARGMTLQNKTETSANLPGGIRATWVGHGHTLEFVAWPTLNAPPPRPPLKPATPLDWVVQYSYPADDNLSESIRRTQEAKP